MGKDFNKQVRKDFYEKVEKCIDREEQKKRLAGMVWPDSDAVDDVEEIRILADIQSFRAAPMMQQHQYEELKRQKEALDALRMPPGFSVDK